MVYIHCWNDTKPNIPEDGTRTLALYVHSRPGLSLDNVPCIVKLRGNLFTLLNIAWTVNLSSRSLCLTGSPGIEQENSANLCHPPLDACLLIYHLSDKIWLQILVPNTKTSLSLSELVN